MIRTEHAGGANAKVDPGVDRLSGGGTGRHPEDRVVHPDPTSVTSLAVGVPSRQPQGCRIVKEMCEIHRSKDGLGVHQVRLLDP